jgi:hypothetical protein
MIVEMISDCDIRISNNKIHQTWTRGLYLDRVKGVCIFFEFYFQFDEKTMNRRENVNFDYLIAFRTCQLKIISSATQSRQEYFLNQVIVHSETTESSLTMNTVHNDNHIFFTL